MKKLFTLFLCICLSFGCLSLSVFASDEISVYLDGQKLEFDVPPVMINDRVLVPMRAIFEALGAEVSWDDATQSVLAKKQTKKIVITVNSSVAVVDGVPIPLDASAQLFNNRTLVPLRFISESLGCSVSWNEVTQSVDIQNTSQDLTNKVIYSDVVVYIDNWAIPSYCVNNEYYISIDDLTGYSFCIFDGYRTNSRCVCQSFIVTPSPKLTYRAGKDLIGKIRFNSIAATKNVCFGNVLAQTDLEYRKKSLDSLLEEKPNYFKKVESISIEGKEYMNLINIKALTSFSKIWIADIDADRNLKIWTEGALDVAPAPQYVETIN